MKQKIKLTVDVVEDRLFCKSSTKAGAIEALRLLLLRGKAEEVEELDLQLDVPFVEVSK